MNVLVINAGSSSVKFTCTDGGNFRVLAAGLVERIGLGGTAFTYRRPGAEAIRKEVEVENADQAVHLITACLTDETVGVMTSPDEIGAIGHRIVHGGEKMTAPELIDERIKGVIEECLALAPLHNRAHLDGINACEGAFPAVPQVAVFDTAFHATMPSQAYLYGLPIELYRQDGIRRYGFHGTSHKYVSRETAAFLDRDIRELRIVSCHLGNGCSICAIDGGRCIDTSMGFTPLEGLMMGTRCGDIDAAVIFYLMNRKNMSVAEVNDLLNKRSGIYGLAGIGSCDFRDIASKVVEGHEQVENALDVFCYRIRKVIGSYMAVMDGLDALVFTAGIGENCVMVRARTCAGMEKLGIILDSEKNETVNGTMGEIGRAGSPVKILIVPTNEELEIARETMDVINGKGREDHHEAS